MFDENTRYMTSGIQNEMPSELVFAMWNSIDLQVKGNRKMDYLQVFKFEKIGEKVLAIRHEQEKPVNKLIIYIEYKDEYANILKETVFVIDDGDHSTMLFGYEY